MVKCSQCGLLGARSSLTRQIIEAESVFREEGSIPNAPQPGGGGGMPSIDNLPVCLARKRNFRELAHGKAGPNSLRPLLSETHDCDSFIEWQQGFSPKEHAELKQLDEQREWQRKCEKDQAERDRKWRQEDVDRANTALIQARRHHWMNLIVFGLLITMINVLVAFLAK